MVRKINTCEIKNHIKEMYIKMNYSMGEDVATALTHAVTKETSSLSRSVLTDILENGKIAENDQVPLCQDTGMAVLFVEIGQDIVLEGQFIGDAINDGVRAAYDEGFLRKSVVSDPLNRVNTMDNTPAIVHYEIVPGDRMKIIAAAKGFGSENMSQIKMLNPSDGRQRVIDFVVDTVRAAGSNPCPPIIVGVGIGGTMEKAALLSKKALVRDIGKRHDAADIAEMEVELLEKINKLNIGPQGFGGACTALGVLIETFPTHIAGLPVAVNINCHSSRHMEVHL